MLILMYVYCLVSTDGSTYIGATVDLEHRLRQHNKELVGGARITSRKVVAGHSWKCECFVEGFPNWQACLQFEWRWKQISRKVSSSVPLERRKEALKRLLELDRSTSKAIPYAEWKTPPKIVYPESVLPKRIDFKHDEIKIDEKLFEEFIQP